MINQEWLEQLIQYYWGLLPKSLQQIIADSLIPYTGIAILPITQDKVTPCILHSQRWKTTTNHTTSNSAPIQNTTNNNQSFIGGAELYTTQLETVDVARYDLRIFTQQFRCQHELGIAVGIDIDFCSQCHKQHKTIWDFLASYGRYWAISIPMEWDDFLLSLPKIIRYFALQQSIQDCKWDCSHFFTLFQNYLENFIKDIREQSIFIQFEQQQQKIIFELSQNGIYECSLQRPIVEDRLFIIDLDMLHTFLPWLSDTSLRLVTRFISAILPAEIAESIQRQECLMYLVVQDSHHKHRDLFIWGSRQHLPNRLWQGDCYGMLMQKSSRRLIWQEYLPMAALIIQQEQDTIEIRVPNTSHIQPLTLLFQEQHNMTWNQGCSKFISNTSILADLAPGLRNIISFAKLAQTVSVNIAGETYQVIAGDLCYIKSHGKILKRQGFVYHLRHWWTTPQEAGFYCAGTYNPKANPPLWWKSLVEDTESGGMIIRATDHYIFSPLQTYLPQWQNLQNISWTKSCGKFGFSNYAKLKFWLGNAWVMPYDHQGNCVIRGPGLVTVGKQIGIAMLEFPCRMLDELSQAMPIELREWHGQLQFSTPTSKLLVIQQAQYLRRFRPGPSWAWRYVLHNLGKDQNLPAYEQDV